MNQRDLENATKIAKQLCFNVGKPEELYELFFQEAYLICVTERRESNDPPLVARTVGGT